MIKITFICLLLSVVTYSQTIITRSIDDFSVLKIYNGIDLELIKSDVAKIVITGEKAYKVKLTNKINTLKIYLKFPEILADNKVKVTLFYKNIINTIDANEGATVTAKNFKQQQLEVKAQEGALINMIVDIKHLTVKSVSSGIVKLTGTTKNQNIEANTGGVYYGFKIKATDTSIIRTSLGGKAEVLIGETLDAKVSFGGTIFYKGTPEILKTKKVIGGIIEQIN